nr:membrane-spanning 4-domains subfamily A member 15-like [Misgurnus anguillicaudatus]
MSNQVISAENATVVIQINPLIGQESAEGQDKRGTYAPLQGFLKVQPKTLGSVQIVTGVVTLLTNIVLTTQVPNYALPVLSVNFLGSFIYIMAGSLSVVVENKLHSCVVKASLGMNVVSAIIAGAAIILISFQLEFVKHWGYFYRYASEDFTKSLDEDLLSDFQVLGRGIIGILLVFSILQFILSIVISGFACKATCDTNSSVVNVSLKQRVSEKETSPLNMPQPPRRN